MAGHLDSATATRKRRSGAEALEIVGGKISEIRDYDERVGAGLRPADER
jgi:hypothetical protein